jgi:Dolichyl-phosphate-mannose-protein mannosyltransferase
MTFLTSSSETVTSTETHHQKAIWIIPWPAIAFLLLTVVYSLVWSHHKLMSQDEFFVLQTDSASSFAQLIHIQSTYPVSLDPLVYHSLTHMAIKIFGAGAFALRLPSLLGYLLMQLCLFFFVRRIATERAAIFALAFPMLTATFFYSAEGRPYGLLLGLYGLTMVSWQAVTRRDSQRTFALISLALSVALSLNTHYFGILLLLPLCAAELFRTIQRRRLDLPVFLSILIGMGAIVLVLPFAKAAVEFRKNYYNAGAISYHDITQAYRSIFLDYTQYSMTLQHFAAIGLVFFAIAFLWGCIRQLRSSELELPNADIVFLVVLAALPFFGYLMARFVTHSVEVRYVLGAIIGISALLSIAATPLFRHNDISTFTLLLLVAAIVVVGILRINTEQKKTQAIMASLTLNPQLKTAIMATPSKLLYFQDLGFFEVASYYEPDPDIRPLMALIYSREQELRWDFHDTESLAALRMRNFTGFPIFSYESLATQPDDHIFVLFHSGWDWTDQALASTHANITPLGPAFGGDAVSVRFPPQTNISHPSSTQ